ncbi:MAG TPA: ATP-binding cassette domain-containing protein [Phycisphaerales bacterium]|nr:ATP-binding cassette domain-containing protein [Phycisphaerales bacterium]
MVTATDLHFAYRGKGAASRREVVRGVSLKLPAGSVTAVLGPNGAGKSTLLRLLLGTLTPAAGVVRLGAAELQSVPVWRRAAAVAYIGQRSTLAGPMTVRRVVELGRYAVGASDAAVDRAMERAGVGGLAGAVFDTLSAGQQQRVALARAAAQLDGPGDAALAKTLLADEPVSAMDPRHALEALTLLRSLASGGVAVCVVLHDLTLALRFADAALLMDEHGSPVATGPAADVLRPEVLAPAYGVAFEVLNGSGGGAVVPAV